jgi:SPOR domain
VTAAATEPSSRLRCPRCGARLAPDQDWCLECGAAATTRILRPPSWKLAGGVVLGVLAVVVVAIVIAVNSLSRDADRAVATRAARSGPSAASSTAGATTKTPAPASRTAAATTPVPAATSARPLATWPQGRTAWTVVLVTGSNRAAAERSARDLVARGVRAGVLDASRFDVAASGAAFVVFSGQFPDQATAVAGEARLRGKVPTSAFVAEVSPR